MATKLERIAAILKEPNPIVDLAESFCALDDEQQADFFIHCARIMCAWNNEGRGYAFSGHAALEWQMCQVGSHLRTCECSTEDARDLVRALARGLEAAP